MTDQLDDLARQIAACTICAAALPVTPRPVVQLGTEASILIIGQAPGRRVHESGIPWDDDSGRRLREWLGIAPADFYDRTKVALMPMGFCYPGTGDSGDLPPRHECAPAWHDRILPLLNPRRLTVLVGTYAQKYYDGLPATMPLVDRIRSPVPASVNFVLLPHPSWRSTGWMRRNPWFETDVLPHLRAEVARRLAPDHLPKKPGAAPPSARSTTPR